MSDLAEIPKTCFLVLRLISPHKFTPNKFTSLPEFSTEHLLFVITSVLNGDFKYDTASKFEH